MYFMFHYKSQARYGPLPKHPSSNGHSLLRQGLKNDYSKMYDLTLIELFFCWSFFIHTHQLLCRTVILSIKQRIHLFSYEISKI